LSKRYLVLRREVHVSHIPITADSKEQAIQKVADGEGEEIFLEYSHTLAVDTWTVEDLSEEKKDGNESF